MASDRRLIILPDGQTRLLTYEFQGQAPAIASGQTLEGEILPKAENLLATPQQNAVSFKPLNLASIPKINQG